MKLKLYFFLYLLCLPILMSAQFTQIASDIDGEFSFDESGGAVAISANGTIVAIGAIANDGNGTLSGHVRVFEKIGPAWTQIGNDIDGEFPDDQSGVSVAINDAGTIVAIGAARNDGTATNAGHVRVYQNIGGTWTQIGSDINGEAAEDRFGISVSLNASGNILAVGADLNDGAGSTAGHVRVYNNIGGTWTQIGSDIDGETMDSFSGASVSLNDAGDIVAIGAFGNNSFAGHVRVYQNTGGTWTQVGADIDGEAAGDRSGSSVSINGTGNILAIGAFLNNSQQGHVRIYENSGGTWTQVGADINGENSGDRAGGSVSLNNDGTIVAIGAVANDGDGLGLSSGHVRVFENIGGTWTQVHSDVDAETSGDTFGRSVSISNNGGIFASGANQNDGNGSNAGHVRVFQNPSILNIEEVSFASQIFLSPNPASGKTTLKFNTSLKDIKVSLYDLTGNLVKTLNDHQTDLMYLDIANLAQGMYFVQIRSESKKAVLKLIIK
ncbi:T9SS type A sorting domain-containing protein [Kordia sp. YSTF-M3]|uniref:T9SS type A sorting domain-containing protein n=1 Tax=Kordia aestuariivivens TaxID=2759037 RepID=A0ABR7Q948_9FLAO|nr:T9SS type A sorting domain-containing protein [Kordia aestuariivivens]MBC8754958.1 T9SS type A sorting domain-containing protein [Kordia aestuariivivens]